MYNVKNERCKNQPKTKNIMGIFGLFVWVYIYEIFGCNGTLGLCVILGS